MKDERGSLTVLGLFTVIALILVAVSFQNATALYLQKRQLSSLSDALALDLADYLQISTSEQTQGIAVEELKLLNVTGRETELAELLISSPKVSLTLCQAADFPFLPLRVSSVEVCADSTATTY